MKLFVSKKGTYGQDQLTEGQKKVKLFLDRSRDGELFLTEQVAASTGIFYTTLTRYQKVLPGYSYNVGRQRYWGKPSTIKQLIKENR